jgi:voltage-gated potassium channel
MDPMRLRFRVYLVVLLGVVVLGAIGFSYADNISFMDALYFGIVTVATVGYGDIHPITAIGKLLAMLLIICGVGTFLGVIFDAHEI